MIQIYRNIKTGERLPLCPEHSNDRYLAVWPADRKTKCACVKCTPQQFDTFGRKAK
jgi:hypothetical protein